MVIKETCIINLALNFSFPIPLGYDLCYCCILVGSASQKQLASDYDAIIARNSSTSNIYNSLVLAPGFIHPPIFRLETSIVKEQLSNDHNMIANDKHNVMTIRNIKKTRSSLFSFECISAGDIKF